MHRAVARVWIGAMAGRPEDSLTGDVIAPHAPVV
jgi:hypothetical protein